MTTQNTHRATARPARPPRPPRPRPRPQPRPRPSLTGTTLGLLTTATGGTTGSREDFPQLRSFPRFFAFTVVTGTSAFTPPTLSTCGSSKLRAGKLRSLHLCVILLSRLVAECLSLRLVAGRDDRSYCDSGAPECAEPSQPAGSQAATAIFNRPELSALREPCARRGLLLAGPPHSAGSWSHFCSTSQGGAEGMRGNCWQPRQAGPPGHCRGRDCSVTGLQVWAVSGAGLADPACCASTPPVYTAVPPAVGQTCAGLRRAGAAGECWPAREAEWPGYLLFKRGTMAGAKPELRATQWN